MTCLKMRRTSQAELFHRETHRPPTPAEMVNPWTPNGSMNLEDPRGYLYHWELIRADTAYFRVYQRALNLYNIGRGRCPVLGEKIGMVSPPPEVERAVKCQHQAIERRLRDAGFSLPTPPHLFQRVEEAQTPTPTTPEVDPWARTPGREVMPGTFVTTPQSRKRKVDDEDYEIDEWGSRLPKRPCAALIKGTAELLSNIAVDAAKSTRRLAIEYGPPAAQATWESAKICVEKGPEVVKRGATAVGQGARDAGIATGHAAINATIWSFQHIPRPAYAIVREVQARRRRSRHRQREARGPNGTMISDQLQRVIDIHDPWEDRWAPVDVKFRETTSLVTETEDCTEAAEDFVEVYSEAILEQEKINKNRKRIALEKARQETLKKELKERFLPKDIDWRAAKVMRLTTTPEAKVIMSRTVHRNEQLRRKRQLSPTSHIDSPFFQPQRVDTSLNITPSRTARHDRTGYPAPEPGKLAEWLSAIIEDKEPEEELLEKEEPESPAAANVQNPSHPAAASNQETAQPAQPTYQSSFDATTGQETNDWELYELFVAFDSEFSSDSFPSDDEIDQTDPTAFQFQFEQELSFDPASVQGTGEEDNDSLFDGFVSIHSFDSLFDLEDGEIIEPDLGDTDQPTSQPTQRLSVDTAAGQATDDTELSSAFDENELPELGWDADHNPTPSESDSDMSRYPTDAERREHKKQLRRNMKRTTTLSLTDMYPLEFIDYDSSEEKRQWGWPAERNGELIPINALLTPDPYLPDTPATQLESELRRAAKVESDDSSSVSSTFEPSWVPPRTTHRTVNSKDSKSTTTTTPDAKGKLPEKTPSTTAEPTAAPSTGHNAEGSSSTPVTAQSSDGNATLRTPTSRSSKFRRRAYQSPDTAASAISTPASAISSTYKFSPGPTPRLEDNQEHIDPQTAPPVAQTPVSQTPNVETRSAAHARQARVDEPETTVAEPKTPETPSSTNPAGPALLPSPFKATVTILQQNVDVQSPSGQLTTPKPKEHATEKTAHETTRITRKQALEKKKADEVNLYEIVPINEAQRATVQAAVRKGTKNLPANVFARLAPPAGAGACGTDAWLDDEAVNEYLGLVVAYGRQYEQPGTKVPSHHAFNSFFYKNLCEKGLKSVQNWARRAKINGRNLLNVKYVFIPINAGHHWTLAVIEGREKRITYYDSLGGNGKEKLKVVRSWVKEELGGAYEEGEWVESVGWSARQRNSDDCGVFTVTNAKNLVLKGRTEGFDAGVQRERMVVEIVEGKLVRKEREEKGGKKGV